MRTTLAVLTVLLIGCSTKLEGLPAEIATTTIGTQGIATVAFTEGPTVDRDGNVYFSEMLTGRILKYTPENDVDSPAAGSKDARRSLSSALGGVETFRSESKGANGLIFDRQGRLIAAEVARVGAGNAGRAAQAGRVPAGRVRVPARAVQTHGTTRSKANATPPTAQNAEPNFR